MAIDWNTEYPITNTGYEQPNTQVAFMAVPWDNTYTDIVDFDNLSAQTSAMNALIQKTINYMNYFKKDNAFDVAGNVAEYENYNYLRYINKNYNNKYFYCFITKVEYRTKDCTRIYVQTDVWQTWQFNLTFYQSFIERAHVAKSDDTIGGNLQNEPLSATPEYERQIDIFNGINWGFSFILTSVSAPPTFTGQSFTYGGVGNNTSEFVGYYCYDIPPVNTAELLQAYIALYQPEGEVTDHRQDIINIKAMPLWAINATSKTEQGYFLNTVSSVDDNITINLNILANGYTPRNKKLLTSLYRIFSIYNLNGFEVPILPELIMNPLGLHISTKVATSSQLRLTITNYSNYSNNHYSIPYNYTMAVGYNENTGATQEIAQMNATLGLLSSIGGAVGGVATGVATGNALATAQGFLGGVQGIANSAIEMKKASEERTASLGSASDGTSILPTNIQLRLLDSCPTLSECQRIDKFFDVFGYAQNTFGNVKNWFTNRSAWNYIKTTGCKIRLTGNQSDLSLIKSIFDSGVTVWHSINGYGDYTQDNN